MRWLAVLVLVALPLRILSRGYLPGDDALRHAAKAVSGKPWSEILVLRPDVTIDQHAGWHAILAGLHRAFGLPPDGLVAVAVAALFLLPALTGLFILRKRPEAWLLALLALNVADTSCFQRLMIGRPFLVAMTALLALMTIWGAPDAARRPGMRIAATTGLCALATWIHGSWYLFVLPAAAFFLAGKRREAAGLLAGWVLGAILGACLTGMPVAFLVQQVRHLTESMGHAQVPRQLVTEFRPSTGEFATLIALAVAVLARRVLRPRAAPLARDPLAWLAGLGWLGGLAVYRTWLDWGWPAALLWLALEIRTAVEQALPPASWKRVGMTALAGAALYLSVTSDSFGRWTQHLTDEALTPETPGIGDWLPGAGGIVYSDDMRVFYRTFFANPRASWRYQLGYEATLMPREDLRTLYRIQWNYGDGQAFAPWVAKMRPPDRLILSRAGSQMPAIPGLEWKYAATDTWIGRVPAAMPPPSPPTRP